MQDLTHKVRAALEVYLKYGHAALESLMEAQTEEFFAIMSERETAFQNFCALDAAMSAAGWDAAKEPALRRLWRDVDLINRTLYGRMTEVQAKMVAKRARSPVPPGPPKRRAGTTLRLVKHG